MYHLSKLKNGATLIAVPVPGTKAATVLAMFPVGSRYETKKLSGASHFVEHMMFKGTTKRTTAVDISRTLEAVGADYNAFTNKDYTGYFVKINGKKQEIAFDLLSDMVFNSKFEKEEVEREKGAIVEELRMYKDNPTMAVDMLFDATAFGDHPLGWDVGGTEDTVRGLTREELWQYYHEHYSPKNMVLIVAGDVAKGKKNISYFENVKVNKNAVPLEYYKKKYKGFEWPKKASLEKRIAVNQKKVDQAHVIIGFPGLENGNKDRYALSILLNILGGGMSSRLFVEVRERRGLAYMVRAGSASYRDVGAAYVQAGLDPARLQEAAKVIKGELNKITAEPVSGEELVNAKNNIAGRIALSMEDSSAQAEWFAKQWLFNKQIETTDDMIKNLNKVTVGDVQKIAKKVLQWDNARVAVIGSTDKAKVLKMFV